MVGDRRRGSRHPRRFGAEHRAAASGSAAVERGRYLVRITGCHDCHSPKVQGMTPDQETGTYLQTITPIRNAVYAGLTPPGGAMQKPKAGGQKPSTQRP